jgi:hypothetical protein
MEKTGQKHAVKCRCILPQFKKRKDPIFHEFIVFSTVTDGEFDESFVQCNNCGIVHRVVDFCKSEITTKENVRSVATIEDISFSLSDSVTQLLNSNNADLATFQEVAFIMDNKVYGKKILLEKEIVDGYAVGKFLTLQKDSGRLRVEPFSYQDGIKK